MARIERNRSEYNLSTKDDDDEPLCKRSRASKDEVSLNRNVEPPGLEESCCIDEFPTKVYESQPLEPEEEGKWNQNVEQFRLEEGYRIDELPIEVTDIQPREPEKEASLYPDVEQSPPEDGYRIDEIPPELRERIFSYLDTGSRRNVRLVCKSFYQACNRNECICFGTCGQEHEYGSFKNCGLRFMDVSISCSHIHKWPSAPWESVGARIHSLHLYNCRLGNETMKNVIVYCDSLRALRITIKEYDPSQSFCTPDTLEKLNVLRKTLTAFSVHVQTWNCNVAYGYYHAEWKRILGATFRIFPNIVEFTGGKLHGTQIVHECQFTVSTASDADQAELSSSLAHLLGRDTEHRFDALDVLSATRLKKFSMTCTRYATDLEETFSRFFGRQNQLESAIMRMGVDKGELPACPQEQKSMTNIIHQILRKCCGLSELLFSETRLLSRSLSRVSWLSWMLQNAPHQVPYFISRFTTLNKLDMDYAVCKRCSHYLLFVWRHRWRDTPLHSFAINFLQSHAHIQHLRIDEAVSDSMLQTIFQFMPNLKILDIRLTKRNSISGLMGPPKLREDETRNSITNLRNLERLLMQSSGFKYNDSVFRLLDLPKLQYLFCFPPRKTATYTVLAHRLPALREIKLEWLYELPNVLVFCKAAENIRSISLADKDGTFELDEVRPLFDARPSLRTFQTLDQTFYRAPFTEEVRVASSQES